MLTLIKRLIFSPYWLFVLPLHAGAQSINLQQCLDAAKINHPLVAQLDLLKQSESFNLSNASTQYLPQMGIFGQATYQSDVTSLPIKLPGVQVPELSKDQYKLYAEVSQLLYDGGVNKNLKQDISAASDIEKAKVESDLYALEERVIQMYFGILIMDERIKQLHTARKDVEAAHLKLKSALEAGTVLKSQLMTLDVELLNIQQKVAELTSNRNAYLLMLSKLTGLMINETSQFVHPDQVLINNEIKRPELLVFDLQQRRMDLKYGMLGATLKPRVSLFLQAGIGRPALNMLDNTVKPYGIGGVRLSFPLNGFYTLKRDKALIEVYKSNIEVNRKTFLLNTDIKLSQVQNDMNLYSGLDSSDAAIIKLRNEIKITAMAQLEMGIITSADYLREVNAEQNARINAALHRLQYILSQYQYNQISGK